MSWLFSRALVAAFSEGISLDGEPCAQSNGAPIQQAYCAPDKMTEFSRLSRFGMTYKPLMENLGAELLTLYLEGFPVRTSVSQDAVPESLELAPECGATWLASLAKFDRDSHSWKTVQLSLLGDSELSSVTWPQSGMTANGESWELPTLELRTREIGSGLWLPTPCASDHSDRSPGAQVHVTSSGLTKHVAPNGKKSQMRLSQHVKLWPTVCARDYRHPGKSRLERTGSKAGDVLPQAVGGPLNPPWVEWLMGWPLGWTDLKPLAMDKFQEWQQQHSIF
jgi:hypothetical protein